MAAAAAVMKKRAMNNVVYGLLSRQTPYECHRRHLSQIVNPNGTTRVSSLAEDAAKSLEAEGLPSKNQAEAITPGVNNITERCQPRKLSGYETFKAMEANIVKETREFKAELERKTAAEVRKWSIALFLTGAAAGAVVGFTSKS